MLGHGDGCFHEENDPLNILKINNFIFSDFLGWDASVVDKDARNHYTAQYCW